MRRVFLEALVISFIAAGVIFFQYNLIPFGLDYDEVDFARLAVSLADKPYIPFSPAATGHATFYFYVLAAFFKLFGVAKWSLRLQAALFGIFNVVMFYFIIRLIAKNYALALALVLATLRWHFSFARFSYEATFLLFWELTGLYFLLRFFKKRGTADLVLTALFSGFAFNSYTPGRIFFLLPLVILVSLYLKKKIALRRTGLFLGTFLFMILPLISYLSAYSDPRFSQQFFLGNPKLSTGEKIKFFKDGVFSTVLMFHLRGDFNGRHNYPGKPAVNPILGLFFLIGLLIAIKNYKNIYHQVFLIYFLVSLAPTFFSYPHENPHMLRTFTVIPSLIYFVGLSLDFLLKFGRRRKYLFYAVGLLLFISSLYELRTYFFYQRYVTEDAFELAGDLQKMVENETSRGISF